VGQRAYQHGDRKGSQCGACSVRQGLRDRWGRVRRRVAAGCGRQECGRRERGRPGGGSAGGGSAGSGRAGGNMGDVPRQARARARIARTGVEGGEGRRAASSAAPGPRATGQRVCGPRAAVSAELGAAVQAKRQPWARHRLEPVGPGPLAASWLARQRVNMSGVRAECGLGGVRRRRRRRRPSALGPRRRRIALWEVTDTKARAATPMARLGDESHRIPPQQVGMAGDRGHHARKEPPPVELKSENHRGQLLWKIPQRFHRDLSSPLTEVTSDHGGSDYRRLGCKPTAPLATV
jgi:hypothetical protein